MAETRQSVILLLLLIHLNFFAQAEVICPGDYVPSEESSSCIKLFSYPGGDWNWYDSRDECGLDGGVLVKIVNQAMNAFIYDMAMSDRNFRRQREQWTWIGLNDPNFDNTWVWLGETDEAAWTNWISGQPDGYSEYCAVLDAEYNGEWRDITCGYDPYWDGESYVCEIPALTTTIATTTTLTTSTAVTTVTTPATSTSLATSTAVTTATTPATPTSLATTSTTTSSLVVARKTSSGGLGVAAIAGIVTGVLVVAALVPAAFITIRYFRNRQRNDHSVAFTNGLGDREAIVTVG